MTPTEALLAFAAGPINPPPQVRAAALERLADTLLVGAAGSTAPGADGVLAAAQAWGSGQVPLLGRTGRLAPAGAAFVNGFQIHALEWDAVHEPAVVHALSVVTAALHAACHARGNVSHDEALAALIAGVEIACALGLAATGPLRFFRPATAGLIGGALACARIAHLPRDRFALDVFANVLGLAHAQCAGTMQAHVEGSSALPLQIGLAARAAVTAVDLAAAGLTGPHDALTGPFGYFPLFDAGDPTPPIAALGQIWQTAQISIKPWPCGRASHATLGVLAGHTAPDVTRITAHVPPLVARLVGRPWARAMTPAYARLCLPFLTALMLADGHIDPRRFTPASFADPDLKSLAARLAIVVDTNPDPNALMPQRHVIRSATGETTIETTAAPGSPASRTPDLLAAKARLATALAAAPIDPSDPLARLTGSRA